MYKKFKLDIDKTILDFSPFLEKGKTLQNQHLNKAGEIMERYINSDNTLDGTAIQRNWFPKIEADVFLSHSHSDHDLATAFSGWLYEEFGLTTFIDANVWGHAAKLKKKLADNHCKIPNSSLYGYDEFSNASTHVDIMLAAALSTMVDQCECLFFLESPSAILSYEKQDKTKSAWIYAELFFSNLMRRRTPNRKLNESKEYLGDLHKGLEGVSISHDLDLSEFNEIGNTELKIWSQNAKKDEHALDILYNMFLPKIRHQFLS